MADRHAWIRLRREQGFDFGPLTDAVSRLLVTWDHNRGCLVVDSSPVESRPHAVTKWLLSPAGPSLEPGLWSMPLAGETGTLADHLYTIAMIATERPDAAGTEEG